MTYVTTRVLNVSIDVTVAQQVTTLDNDGIGRQVSVVKRRIAGTLQIRLSRPNLKRAVVAERHVAGCVKSAVDGQVSPVLNREVTVGGVAV